MTVYARACVCSGLGSLHLLILVQLLLHGHLVDVLHIARDDVLIPEGGYP